MSEELLGGVANEGQVIRDGDVVWRPAPDNSDTLHSVLNHLAKRGFTAPVPIEERDRREAVRYIEGEVSLPPFPETWVRGDWTLQSVGRLLRSYHDAAEDFALEPDMQWSTELSDPSGGSLVCHNDVCIENVVFRDGDASGLLDFDFAAPGRPVWDLVMTARYWVPLLDPESASATSRENLDVRSRVRLFADAYGLDRESRKSFGNVLEEAEDVALRFVLDRIERSEEAFLRMWYDLGGEARYERKMKWLRSALPDIQSALL